jgi:hypothetical protein
LINDTSNSCDPSLTQSNMIAPTRWPYWSWSCPFRLRQVRARVGIVDQTFG